MEQTLTKKLNKRQKELLKEFQNANEQISSWTLRAHQAKGAYDEVTKMIQEIKKKSKK